MKIIALALAGFALTLAPAQAGEPPAGKVLYANPGDNTTGFELKFGGPAFTVVDNYLLAGMGGGWYALPVVLTGDFQLDFDVYGDSNDVDSDIIFADDANGEGIEINDCPSDTDTPTINIKSSTDLCSHQGFYFDLTTLVSAPTNKFPKCTWTHIRITKKGNILTDNVGGQVISTDVSDANFPSEARLGLGYYATQNLGGAGQIRYAHIRVVQLPDEGVSSSNSMPDPSPAPRANMD